MEILSIIRVMDFSLGFEVGNWFCAALAVAADNHLVHY